MSRLLKADCVFECLIKEKVLNLIEGKTWKNTSPSQIIPYTCHFFMTKNKLQCLKSFQIIIYKGQHCITVDSVDSLLDGINEENIQYIKWTLANCVFER